MQNKKLIVILGPTGSGKTDVSVRLACKYSLPIISTDSRQIFKGMPIGTAQPTEEQLALAEHHLVACHDITENYTCGRYEREALETLAALYATRDTAIAVGGSGMYIDALCYGMDELPDSDPALREKLEVQWNANPSILLEELKTLDPQYYDQVDKSNPQRVIRAIEVCRNSGLPYSTLRKGEKRSRDFQILKIGITLPREELYKRINLRVDNMIAEGLEAEARTLYSHRELNSLQTVGYREMFEYFDGNISRDQAIELIKRNSRRYAKRQMTWFTRHTDIKWFSPAQISDIEAAVEDFIA